MRISGHPKIYIGPRSLIASSKALVLYRSRQEFALEEAVMTGAVFQPELIELMKGVLEEVSAMLPEEKRTSTAKAEIASNILACAAKGERDPQVLKAVALSAVVDCSHYWHDVSEYRRAI